MYLLSPPHHQPTAGRLPTAGRHHAATVGKLIWRDFSDETKNTHYTPIYPFIYITLPHSLFIPPPLLLLVRHPAATHHLPTVTTPPPLPYGSRLNTTAYPTAYTTATPHHRDPATTATPTRHNHHHIHLFIFELGIMVNEIKGCLFGGTAAQPQGDVCLGWQQL
nr:hypothetical protein [Tanacetum cinerariifolium]